MAGNTGRNHQKSDSLLAHYNFSVTIVYQGEGGIRAGVTIQDHYHMEQSGGVSFESYLRACEIPKNWRGGGFSHKKVH